MSQTILLHNTLRIDAEFRNFDGALTDPDGSVATIKWYDADWNVLTREVLPVANRFSLGVWRYHFVPTSEGVFHHIWSGSIAGKPFERSFSVTVVKEL